MPCIGRAIIQDGSAARRLGRAAWHLKSDRVDLHFVGLFLHGITKLHGQLDRALADGRVRLVELAIGHQDDGLSCVRLFPWPGV